MQTIKHNTGLTETEIDNGIEYRYNGHTLSFCGEQEVGDVHLDSAYIGEYERDYDTDMLTISKDGLTIAEFGATEEEYCKFALQQMQAL